MTRFAFVFCTLGFVYINLFIVISDITILHDMVRRSPEPLGRRMAFLHTPAAESFVVNTVLLVFKVASHTASCSSLLVTQLL